MKEPGFDPRRVAYVSTPGFTSGGQPADSGAALVSATQTLRKINRQSYVVDVPAEGVLVLSEIWFPFWRVKVDGMDVQAVYDAAHAAVERARADGPDR